jgi:hypothetical protein
MKKKYIIISAFIITSVILLLILFFHKPARILNPEKHGFTRVYKNLYIDNPASTNHAMILYERALKKVDKRFGLKNKNPRIIFCTTDESFDKFGYKNIAARAQGTFGVIIGPKGWYLYIIEHELIHFWQAENLGTVRSVFYPQWMIEGMAYSLSEDPRNNLTEPWKSYRIKFNEWYETIDKDNLGDEMRNFYSWMFIL